MYAVVPGVLIPCGQCVLLISFMKNTLRKKVNRWTSVGYLMTCPGFHLKVKMQQFWKSKLRKFQWFSIFTRNIRICELSSLLTGYVWECEKKIDGSFSYLWDFYKVFFPWFLQYLQKYECRLKVFPLKWDTSWISLLCLSTVFIKDGEILFLLNSKDAFFLLYPSSFSTVRSSPQDTMNWLCGIIGLNRCPFNDSACESADQFYAIKELIAVKIFPNIWVFIESNFKPSWSLLINC